MAYIGTNPTNTGTGLFSQDTFTGDGSTVAFDLTNAAPDGGGNELQVFVDNVRQQEGSSNAYTLGFDGSSVFKRITFTAAPAASAAIYVLNPGTKNVQQISTVSDNAVTTAKVQDSAVTTAKITDLNVTTGKIAADAIDATKLADDAISEEHLDVTAITGHSELSATAADDDVLLVYDTSAGIIKKIQRSNISLSVPTFSSVSPTSLLTGDGTGNHTIVVTGTKFDTGATFSLITDSGTNIAMDSVTRNSPTQLTGTVAKNTANLTTANEPFDIKITNGNTLTLTSENQINVDASPVYITAAGSLGTVAGGSSTSKSVNATDPESAGNVTFELQSGSLPAGLSLVNTAAEGGTAIISGTPTNPSANTTSNFTLRAVDAASNTTSRAFSITVNRTFSQTSFTSSGTFAVPSGITSLDAVMVVAGGGTGPGNFTQAGSGGGGGGGMIFMPEYPVTASGTLTVTVGNGGAGGSPGQKNAGADSVFGAPGDPGLGQGGVLTAKGGGAGSGPGPGADGGSAGGGAGSTDACAPNIRGGGAATQPTQPGNSGAYGFGGGGGAGGAGPQYHQGGGGGGAGGNGSNGRPQGTGDGNPGKAYTIADGTTPVYYAGGGGGGKGQCSNSPGQGGTGGGGSGGNGGAGQNGTGNRGGGGGGGKNSVASSGGKGIVIVRY